MFFFFAYKFKKRNDPDEIKNKNFRNFENFTENNKANNKYSDFSLTLHDSKEKKLQRNRESARNSRKRKKIYIEMLESKVNKIKRRTLY